MQNKKALILTASFPTLIQPWLVDQIAFLLRNNHQVDILAMNDRRQEPYLETIKELNLLERTHFIQPYGKKGLKTVLANFNPLTPVKAWRNISKVTRAFGELKNADFKSSGFRDYVNLFIYADFLFNGYDIVHSHSESPSVFLRSTILASGYNFVTTFHGLQPVGLKNIPQSKRSLIADAAKSVLVNTNFAKKQYMSIGGDQASFSIIPQGIDLELYNPDEVPDKGSDGRIHLLSVGRLHPDKGHTYAIEAVKRLLDRGYDIDYTVVGNGPLKGELQDAISDCKSRIEIKSGLTTEELLAEYRKSHIFLFPSLRSKDGFHEETQGVAMQEAQSMKSIVVAARSGGISECICDGVTGLLVEDRSSEDIEQALIQLLDNRRIWTDIQQNATDLLKRRFDINVIGRRLLETYYPESAND